MPTRITERTGVFFARRTIDRDSVRYTPRVVDTDTTDVFMLSLSVRVCASSARRPSSVRRPCSRSLSSSRSAASASSSFSGLKNEREKRGDQCTHARAKKKRVARVRSFFICVFSITEHRVRHRPERGVAIIKRSSVRFFFLFAGKHPWDISSLFSLSFYRYDHSVCVTCASRRPAEKKGEKTHPERGAHARTTPGISGFPIASPAQVSPGRSNGFREDFVMSEISDFEWRRPRTTTTTADGRRRRIDGGPATERTDEGSDGKD